MYPSNRSAAEQTQSSIDRMALGDVANVVTIERQVLIMPDSEAKERLHQAFERKAQPLIDATFAAAGGQSSYSVSDFQNRLCQRTGTSYQFTLGDMVADEAMNGFVRQAAQQFPKVAPVPVNHGRDCDRDCDRDCACNDDLDDDDFSDAEIVRAVMDDEEVQRAVGRRFLQVLADHSAI